MTESDGSLPAFRDGRTLDILHIAAFSLVVISLQQHNSKLCLLIDCFYSASLPS